jgi:hypothetical protein
MKFYRVIAPAFFLFAFLVPPACSAGDSWIDRVVEFTPGTFSGFGQDSLPYILFGPPEGLAPLEGSVDVVSLGHGGSIVISFENNVVVDGPGADLAIFENAFFVAVENGAVFTEYAVVQLSPDGRTWYEYPHDDETGEGLAGAVPVYSNSQNGLDPFLESSGGDRFDLAVVGLPYVRRVRIIDGGDEIDDVGNVTPPGSKGGFDLDAVGAIHSGGVARIEGVILADGVPVPRALVKIVPADGFGRIRKRRAGADGRFRFRSVSPSGELEVRAKRSGLGRAAQLLDVAADSLVFDISLSLR